MTEARSTNGVTWKWLVGVLLTLTLTASGWAWASLAERLSNLERAGNARAERLAVVESQTHLLEERLTRIEAKLDRILSQQRQSGP